MRSIIKNIGIDSFVERMQTFTDDANSTAEGAWEYFEFDDSSLFKGKTKKAVMEYFDKFREFRQTPALDAPFKENYHEFVLKNLLRSAAENGYDTIGWTPAEVQSERWSDKFAEGYRIEYDQDIPKFLKKYGKQWGAAVGSTVLNNGTEVWSMDITDRMKNAVLYEGQVQYSDRDILNGLTLDNVTIFIIQFHFNLNGLNTRHFQCSNSVSAIMTNNLPCGSINA